MMAACVSGGSDTVNHGCAVNRGSDIKTNNHYMRYQVLEVAEDRVCMIVTLMQKSLIGLSAK
jgi:hypothetical protein